MWTAYILVASALITAGMQTSLNASAGKDVVLPCACPGSDGRYLVWQIREDIVDFCIQGQNEANISTQFQGRTRLFFTEDNRNCSLQLLKVTKKDEGTYTCYYKNSGYDNTEVNLTVSESPAFFGTTEPPSNHRAALAVGGVILVLAALVAVVLMMKYRDSCLRVVTNRSKIPTIV